MKTIFYNSSKALKLFLSFTIAPKVTKRLALLVFLFFASVNIFGQQSTLTISTSATSGGAFSGTAPNRVFTPSASTANIQASALVTELLTNNVTINTAFVGGTGTGNVTFSNPITAASTSTTQRTFTINAGGSITVSASSAINLTPASNSGNSTGYPATNIVLTAVSNVNIASAITTNGGAQTRSTNTNNGGNAGNITITGPTGISFNSNLSAVGGASATATAGTNGTITINDGSSTVTTGGGVNDGQTAGVISGGGLTKSGTGTLVLSGANTFTGLTTVSAGVLNIQNATATGTTAGGVTVTSGAALQVQGGITVGAEALTLNGTGVSTDGALRSVGTGNLTNTWGGTITLGSTARINADAGSTLSMGAITATNISLSLGGIGNINVTGAITIGTGGVTDDGPGNVTFSGTNTYTGATTISAGITTLGATNVFADTSNLILNGGTFKTGTSTGSSDTMGTLALSANSTFALGGSAHTMTFSASNAVTWAGTVLTVSSWTGTGGSSGTAGKIVVGTTSSGLTSAQLAKFSFTGYAPGAVQLSTGEVVPTPAPVISSATTASSTYGTASSYTITGSNTPTSYGAIGLPTGMSVDTATGVITVAATTAAGTYSITISAINGSGTGSTTLTYTVNAKALTITGLTGSNKVYNGTTSATVTGTAALSGVISGDTANVTLGGTAAYTFADSAIGTAKTITASGFSISGTATANYSITQPTGLTANITAATPTIVVTVGSYTYSGSAQGPTAVTGNSGSGTVTWSYVGTGSTIYTASSTLPTNAGTYTATASVTANGNYAAASSSATAFTIAAKALTVTGSTTANKVYDGTNTATVTGGTLVGIVGSDVVTLTQSGTFGQTGVGTSIAITSTSTISGTNSANYTLTQPSLTARNITTKALTVSGATTANKEYDGTNTATITAGTLVGIVGSDVVTLTQSGTFSQTTVGTSIAITSTSTISGTNSANYTLTQPSLTARNITAKALTVTGATTANKEYDGTNTATITAGTLVGIVGSDVVTLTQSGTFSQTTVGTSIAITSTSSISGNNSANYSLTQPTLTARDITSKNLTITGLTGSNKVYDGSTSATATGTAALSGLVLSETVTLGGTPIYTFASANVGTAISISTTGYTISGTTAVNYTLTQPTLSANITQATPTVTPTVGSYTYSGSAQGPNAATNSGTGTSYTFSYVGTGSTSYAASATQPTNAGTYTVTVTVAANGNYASASSSATAFTITKATPTATLAVSNSPATYSGSAQSATVSISASSVPGTVTTISTGGSATQTAAGTYAVTASFEPTDSANYNNLTLQSAGNFVINKAATTTVVTINGGPFAFTGLAQTPATVSVTGAGGLSLTPTADYTNNTNAGTATASYAYAGDDNYLSSSDSANFTIGKATTTTVVTIPAGPFAYTGSAQTPATVTVAGAGGLSLTPTADYTNNINAGTATASYAYAGDDNYLPSSDSANFTIGKAATTTVVTINGGPFAYTGLAQTPATVTVAGAGGLSLTPTADYTNNINAGTATASYAYAGDDNYLPSSDSANFTIGKATTTTVVTIPAGPFAYTGSAQTPATVTVTGAGGLNLTPTADYTNNTNAGTATASYTYDATANYLSSSDSANFTIGKATTTTVVTINEGPFAFTGLAQTPATVTVTGAGGLNLTPTADYTNNTNAGTATASYTYAETANYLSSSDSANFTIGKATTTTVVTISAGPFGYTGLAQTPATVTVTGAGGLSLTPTADYTNNTNAGTATASYTYAATANYLSSSDSEDFTIGKAATTTTVTINGGPFAYTGLAQTPATVSVTGAGGLSLTPTADYTNNTNAGTATASYAYAGDDNYLSSSDSEDFTIGKAVTTTVVTINGGPFAYTGLAQTPATVTVTGAGGLNLTPIADYTNNTNAGTATASYTYAATANYLSSSDSENFTIGKAVTTTVVTISEGPFAYTGLAQTPATVSVTGAGGLNLTPTADYTNNTNAGTATASYTYAATANYLSSSDSANFTIGKATTTTVVTISEGPFAYTGLAQTPATVSVTGVGGLSLTPTADYTNNTNAGTATASYTYAGDDNYLPSSDSANFTIGKAVTTTTVTINGGPFAYNGLAQTPATVVVTGAGGLNLTPTADYTNNTNAGTATASYTYAGDTNHEASSDSEDFTIGKAVTTTVVTIPVGPFAYTGLAQTPATVTVTGAGGLSLTPTADYTNNTNAGTATASYAYAGDDNYLSSSDSANFTIGKAVTTTVVTISEGPFVYTGLAQTPATVTVTGAGGLSLTPTADYTNNTNAGTATASYTYAATANYLSSSDSANFTIGKAVTTTVVTISEGPFAFTGLAQTPATVTVTGAGGLSLTPTADYANNTNAGTAMASYAYSGDENYLSSSDSANFTINKAATTTVVTINGGPFAYTGSAQTPATVTVTGAGGLNLTPTADYTNNTNAGTATASYAYAGDDNYLPSSDSANFTIGKATTTTVVTISEGPFAYTGLAQTPATVTVTGAGGLSLTPTAVYTDNTNAGTATATYAYAGDDNYLSSSDSENFSIGKAVTTTVVTISEGPFVYTGLAQTPATVTVTGAGGLSLTPTADYTNNTNAGTATASYTYAATANYLSSSDSANFTIGKATSVITATGISSYTYTGSTQGPDSSEVIGSTGQVSYVYEGILDTTYPSSETKPTFAGTYQVIATVEEDENYSGASSEALVFTIAKIASTITVVGDISYVYMETAQGPDASEVSGSTGNVSYTYQGKGTTNYGPSAMLPTNVGTYQVTATLEADDIYSGAISDAFEFSIVKASTTITVLGDVNYTYSGLAQGPDASEVMGSTGSVSYVYEGTGVTTYGPDASIPKDSGTYQVLVTVAEDDNYLGLTSDALAFTIEKAALTIIANEQSKCVGSTFSFANTEFTVEGLMEGDLVDTASMISLGSESSAIVSASPYSISISNAIGSGLSNYNINYVNGLMLVTPLSLAGTIVGEYGQICSGSSKILTNANGVGAIQWEMSSNDIDFTPIEDANVSEYEAVVSSNTYFRVVRTSGTCNPVISPSYLVSVASETVAGTILGGNITVCSGTNGVLTIEGSVGSVQWMYAVTSTGTYRTIWGQTGKTLVLNNFSGNNITYYFAKVSLDCSTVVYTNKVTITALKSIAGTISGAGSLCLGNTKTLTLTGNAGKVQWQSSGDNTSFTDIAGATNTSYTTDAITESRYYRAVITNGSCESATTASVAVSIAETIESGIISEGDMVVCKGSSASLNLTGNSSGVITWYKSVNYINATNAVPTWTAVTGQTTAVLNSGSLSVTSWYKAKVNNGNCSIETSVIRVTVNPLSIVKTISGAGAICSGGSKLLTLATGSVGTLQWQSSIDNGVLVPFADIVDAISSTYDASPTSSTWYRVVSTSGVCSSATSLPVAITVNQPALVGEVTATKTEICSGGGITLSLSSAQGSSVWQKATVTNGVLGAFATLIQNTTSVTTGNTLATTHYRVVVTNGVCPAATSNTVIVSVSPTSVVKTITGAGAICNGSSKVLTLATGSVGSTQWQSNSSPSGTEPLSTDGNWTNIEGATNVATYTASPSSTTWYRVVATSGPCSSIASAAVAVTVSQPTSVGTLSALATTVCTGTGTSLSLSSAIGTIAWQKATVSVSGIIGTYAAVTGNVSNTLATGNIIANSAYRVVVSSGVCSTSTSVPLIIAVSPKSVVKTITGAGAICNGTSKVLTLATGSIGSTQWQSNVSSSTIAPVTTDANWTNIEGATDVATYTASPTTTTWYRAVATSGTCSSIASAAVAVTVSQPTSVGTLPAATTLCTGTGTTLSLTSATGTIAWQKATVSTSGVIGTYAAVTGNSTTTLTTGNLTASTAYRVVVSSGVCTASTSNVAIVTVSPTAKVTAITGFNTATTKACVGTPKILTLGIGYVGTIEWLSSTSLTGTYIVIDGATASTYSYVPTSAGVLYFKVRMTSSPCSAQVLSTAGVAVFADTCSVAREMAKDVVSEVFKAIAYPNPSSSVFQIEVSTPTSVKKKLFNVQVYDMTGRFMEQRQVQQSENIEIGNDYPSGIYSIIVTQGEQVKTLRVIKK